ncbi:MAG TPA: AAA family ATPase, partial [Vicinamibacterales bacterium]|nr:AAA family ATPase [Vicinamibacterales bacterium]
MVTRGYAAGAALLRTGPYVVHRGQRTADRQPVLLKTAARGPARRAERDALEREFQLLRSVAIAGVPEAIDLLPGAADGEAPVLVLEDRGFSPIVSRATREAGELSSFFETAMALAGTLADLHRVDLVCGGVTPAALLVAADGRGVQLVDFSLAARVSIDTALDTALSWGVTPYTSPEQTGRINRSVDHRSDLYSLGATLYHLLVGVAPFRSDDPLGLIHAHLAKSPAPPRALDAFVPEQVSAIVMRLLAKAAEDRYQSALGVLADLDVCAREWHATGRVRIFDLGRSDVSDRFLIPQRLYGRERELADLTAAFDDACGGRSSLLLVAGYSGIGKTSLISELYRPIVKQRGYFLAGKFDQVVRSVPYGALIQAFRGFVWQAL